MRAVAGAGAGGASAAHEGASGAGVAGRLRGCVLPLAGGFDPV